MTPIDRHSQTFDRAVEGLGAYEYTNIHIYPFQIIIINVITSRPKHSYHPQSHSADGDCQDGLSSEPVRHHRGTKAGEQLYHANHD